MNEFVLGAALLVGLIWVWSSVFVIKEWERGVLLRLGRVMPEVLRPGLRLALWPVDRVYRVRVAPETMTIDSEELVARGDALVKAGGTCQFRVSDPVLAITKVQDYRAALGEMIVERMRQVASQFTMEDFLIAPEKISEEVKHSLEQTAGEWGLDVLSFEVQSETH